MNTKKLHYFSGVTISIFISVHLFNHLYSLLGANAHIKLMNDLRIVYRNSVVETIILLAVIIQVISGINLFMKKYKMVSSFFDKLQIWSGLYLAFFFIIHISAVLSGRWIMNLDTNFYFGVTGLNTFPYNLFFIPYYGLAIVSFFGHIAVVHSKKMKKKLFGFTPKLQSDFIFIVGFVVVLLTLYGLTNRFEGVEIPEEYQLLNNSSII